MKISLYEEYTKNDLEDILPKAYLREIIIASPAISKIWLFVATDTVVSDDEEEYIGAALYLTYKGNRDIAHLRYIFVDDEFRMKGVGRELITYSTQLLKENGYHDIRVTIADKDNESPDFFKKCRFITEEKYFLTIFRLGDMKNSFSDEKLNQLKPILDKVKRYEELSDANKVDLKKRFLEDIKGINYENINTELSSFYVINNKVLSFLFMDSYKDKYIYSLNILVDDDPASRLALPALFFSTFSRIKDDFSEDAKVEFVIQKIENIDAISKFFGQPLVSREGETMIYK